MENGYKRSKKCISEFDMFYDTLYNKTIEYKFWGL